MFECSGADGFKFQVSSLASLTLLCPGIAWNYRSARFAQCSGFRVDSLYYQPTFIPFAKARKRVETVFSQLCDQYMVIRNYAKQTDGLFARIVGKISALTVAQYINHLNNQPIGRVKYALV